jgi:glycosyltransferase involved in cell wall biosynthesis
VIQHPQLPILGNAPERKRAKPLQVLTLTPFYPSKSDEAAGCFVAEPLAALAKLGIINMAFAVQPFYRGKLLPSRAGVSARWIRYFSFPGGIGLPSAGAFLFARLVGTIRHLHASSKIDLIHAHGPLPCGHAAMLLGAELALPYVVSVHGVDAFSTEQVRGRAGQWCRRISQRVYRSSQRVICVSERVREQVLEGTGPTCRSSVVYNAVDPELFSPPDRETTGQTVLSVGNLIPIKGHETLLKSVASISDEFPELGVEIVGTGPELSRLQGTAQRLGISERVRFLGRQSRAEVADSMRRCTVFALPSRFEGLGCVYLEAMVTSRPVVGCRGQGIAEVIQHGKNGFLVSPDNDRELALALAMLLRDANLRRNLGTAARDTILDRFTLDQQAETLARIYRECVA